MIPTKIHHISPAQGEELLRWLQATLLYRTMVGAHLIHHTGLLIICGKKSEISRDLKRQIRGENGRFRGNFRGKFSPKSKQESKNERFLKKYQKDVKFRAKKKHKSSSNTVLKATVLVSSDKKKHKNLYRNAWPPFSGAI